MAKIVRPTIRLLDYQNEWVQAECDRRGTSFQKLVFELLTNVGMPKERVEQRFKNELMKRSDDNKSLSKTIKSLQNTVKELESTIETKEKELEKLTKEIIQLNSYNKALQQCIDAQESLNKTLLDSYENLKKQSEIRP